MSKMGYCLMCMFDKHEIMGCAAQQFRWAVEDLIISFPLMSKVIKDKSLCKHFEPVEDMEDE